MPQSGGMFWKNFLKASSPPAEAPIPTTAQIGSLRVAWGGSTDDFASRWPFFLRMDGIRAVPRFPDGQPGPMSPSYDFLRVLRVSRHAPRVVRPTGKAAHTVGSRRARRRGLDSMACSVDVTAPRGLPFGCRR